MNKTISVSVKDKIAAPTNDVLYICGNSDFVIDFDFDAEWDEFDTKTARFIYNGIYQDIVFEGNKCGVPIISDAYNIKVGVFAGNLKTTTSAIISAKKSILCGIGSPAAPSDDVYNQIMTMIQGKGGVTPEDVEEAVNAYMEQNPVVVTETDPTVPAWAKAAEKPEYTAEEVGAVSTEELPSAINTALTQAKEIGLFDGKDGVDGKDGQNGYNGSDGITPHIGANGNWFIGDEDTGVSASGGGSTGGGASETLVVDFTVAEDATQVNLPVADMAATFGNAREIVFELSLQMPSADSATKYGNLGLGIWYNWGVGDKFVNNLACLPTNSVDYVKNVQVFGAARITKSIVRPPLYPPIYATAVTRFQNADHENKLHTFVAARALWDNASMYGFALVGSHVIGAGSTIKIYARE